MEGGRSQARQGSPHGAILTAGGTGFMYHDAVEAGELGLQLAVEPLGKVFGGRILEQRFGFAVADFIEAPVVEPIDVGGDDLLDIAEVHEDAGIRLDFAQNIDVEFEAMAMHAPTFVPLGHPGKPVSSFEAKLFGDKYGHRTGLGHVPSDGTWRKRTANWLFYKSNANLGDKQGEKGAEAGSG